MAGLTLGGGSGWLDRKYGLACDSLLPVELVTAESEAILASENVYPDLSGRSMGVAATSARLRRSRLGCPR